MKRIAFCLACASATTARLCNAGGTLSTAEILPLLQQQPAVYEALVDAFTLHDSAFAENRFGNHFENLAGARLGPYEIEATSKKSHKKMTIVVCTKATYHYPPGKEIKENPHVRAESVSEVVTAIMLREPRVESYPPCPREDG